MNVNYKIIGKNIREMRSARGVTQAELAEKVSLSVQFISYIENGTKRPGLETLLRIATSLGTTMDVLLLGSQPRDRMTYQKEVREIFEGCDDRERNYILFMVRALKNGLELLK